MRSTQHVRRSVPGDGMLGGFNPRLLPNLALWLRADLGISTGTGVSAWADQSGSGNSLTQATGSLQPAFIASAVNGRPAVRGDGVDDMLKSGVIAVAQPFTVFCVQKVVSSAANQDVVWALDAGVWFLEDNTPRSILSAGLNVIYNQEIANGTYRVVTSQLNGAASFIRDNGTQVASGDISTGSATSYTLFSFPNGTHAMNVEIAEFVVYTRALSLGEIGREEAYLKARYAL